MIPGKKWRICDYVDHRGRNVVKDDVASYPKAAKAAINAFIQSIEVLDPPIHRSLMKPLKNKNGENGKGLYEFRVRCDGVQYRPILKLQGGPSREIVILAVPTESNERFAPSGIIATCWTRVSRI